MGLGAIVGQLQENLGAPTEEEMERAKGYLLCYRGQNVPGLGVIHVSEDIHVFALQVRVMAMSYVARRREQGQAQPVQTPEETEAIALQRQLGRDYEASTAMAPGTIYERTSLYTPGLQETDLLRFLREDFPYTGKNHLLLLGQTGVGKTFGAIAYVATQAKASPTAHGKIWNSEFLRARELSELLGAGDEKKKRLDRLRQVQWLVIDDLKTEGEGTVTKPFVSMVEDLFSDRHAHRRPTFITSNATAQQIAQTYGDRFVSRFQGDGVVFESKALDLRRAVL